MTLTLISIDSQHQINVSIIFNNTTKVFSVIRESTNDEKISAFICTPGLYQCSFIEALLRNPPPVFIKSQNGKFRMTTIFLDINDEMYNIKCLTYNITRKSYKIETEKPETWEKATFLPSRVYRFCIHRKSLQGPSSNESCEHVPNDLKS